MRRYDKPNKTKQEWEAEMLECLEAAKKRVAHSKGAEREAALEHYRRVLEQFNGLTIKGRIPAKEPCFT
jgi:hypothetical protein